jgi:hypothetical protein
VKPKTQRERKTISSLLENFIPKPATAAPAGPDALGTKRDAWANALSTMNGVYTPSPLTAVAKVAGMGLAGYNMGKASSDIEAGQAGFRTKLAQALKGGAPDNATIADMMADPYAGQNMDTLFGLWERANPKANTDPEMVTLKYPNGTEVPVDLNSPEGKEMHRKFVEKMGSGAGGAGGVIKDPMKITDNMQQSKVQQSAATTAGTLNSMFQSLSDPSAISDLDFVNGVAKILDPTSVVRSEEGRQVIESQSIPSQVLGQLNMLANGESRLDPQTRIAMYQLAARRGGEVMEQAQKEADFYSKMAEGSGYEPELYVPQVPEGPRSDFNFQPEAAAYPQEPAGPRPPPSRQPPATPVPGGDPAAPAPPQRLDPRTAQFDQRLLTVPGARNLWPRIVEQADDAEELETIINGIIENPAMLRQVFPDAFPTEQQ